LQIVGALARAILTAPIQLATANQHKHTPGADVEFKRLLTAANI